MLLIQKAAGGKTDAINPEGDNKAGKQTGTPEPRGKTSQGHTSPSYRQSILHEASPSSSNMHGLQMMPRLLMMAPRHGPARVRPWCS